MILSQGAINIGIALGIVVGVVAVVYGAVALSTLYANSQVRKKLDKASDLKHIRAKRLREAKRQAEEEADRRAQAIITMGNRLLKHGEARTDQTWLAEYFAGKGFKTEMPAYSSGWVITVPAFTEKELADLIVK